MKQPFLHWMTLLQVAIGIIISIGGPFNVGITVTMCGAITLILIGTQWSIDVD